MLRERRNFKQLFFLICGFCFLLWLSVFSFFDRVPVAITNYERSRSKEWYNKIDNVKLPRIAVILTVSLHKRYLFTLPFTVAGWQKLGVNPIVIIVGDYKTLQKQHQSKVTIDFVRNLGAQIHYIQNKTISAPTLSQTSRLFAAAMPFSEKYNDNDIFITSDADMVPFHLANHIPNIGRNQKLYIYNADCYGNTEVPPARGNYSIPMYSMITLGANVATWREIMGFKSTKFNGIDIENYLKIEFGSDFFHTTDGEKEDLKSTLIWYADQSLCSYKIDEWLKKNHTNLWSTTKTSLCARRIDRAAWPEPEIMNQLDLTQWDDAHVIEWGFKDDQWKVFRPFVSLVFKGNEYKLLREKFDDFRQNYISKDCCD